MVSRYTMLTIGAVLLTFVNLIILAANRSFTVRAEETKLANDPIENRYFRAEIKGLIVETVEVECRVHGQMIRCDNP